MSSPSPLARRVVSWSAAVVLSAAALPAQQYDDLFLYIPSIPGSSIHAQFRGWHVPDGFGMMLSRPLGSVGTLPGPLTVSPLSVWMPLTVEAPVFARAALQASALGRVRLVATRGTSAQRVFEIALENTVLRSVRWTGDPSGQVLELGYSHVTWIAYVNGAVSSTASAAVPAAGVRGGYDEPGFDPLPQLGGTLFSTSFGTLRAEDYSISWDLTQEPVATPLRLLSYTTEAMPAIFGACAQARVSASADLFVDWPGLPPFLAIGVLPARCDRVTVQAAGGQFAMELDLVYGGTRWTFLNLYTWQPKFRAFTLSLGTGFVAPPPREPDPPSPWMMFAEFPGYPGSVLVAGYQGWDQAWGFGARAGHALPGAAEPTQLSVLPWDTLPDLIGVLDGQLPALPVVRLHALVPQITPAYFELELLEPTLASVALDGSNVRARFGIVPGQMVWVTRDPFGGPTRRLCWDLVHNRPCQ